MADDDVSYGTGGSCFVCKQSITGIFKETQNRLFHPECFTCWKCKNPLDEKMLSVKKNKMYCPGCTALLFNPRCMRCTKPIDKEELLDVRGNRFHQSCFCCAGCAKPMSPGRHFLINQKVYCEVSCALEHPKQQQVAPNTSDEVVAQ